MLIDSHAHITSDVFENNIEDILFKAKAEGISHIINICTTPLELEKGIRLKERYPWIYNAASTTPHDAGHIGKKDFEFFLSAAQKGQLVAIGETGLDYYYYRDTQEQQKLNLKTYTQLASDYKLPLIIHCREAFEDLFDFFDRFKFVNSVVLHCFTGSYAQAQEVIKRGWYLSLSGIVTFKKSIELQEVAKMVPLSQLLIETDSPYLAPHTKRGMINQPAFLKETAEFIARMRQISFENLSQATFQNACQLFNLKK